MTDWKLIQLNQNKSYFVTDDSTGEELEIQGELMELVRGVNYVMNFYKDTEGFTSDSVLKTIIKVLEIERLRSIGDNSFSVDSFIRENVFDILTRELDNK